MILCPDDHPDRWSNPGEAFASVARELRDEVLTNPEVMTVYVMVGPPGSGKSTWAEENVAGWAMLRPVIDMCNSDPKRRRALAQRIMKAEKAPVAVWMQTPLSECIRRNAEREGPSRVKDAVIVKQHRAIRRVPPSVGEGWADVIEVSP